MNSHSDKQALFPFEIQLKEYDLEDPLMADINDAVIVPRGKTYNKESLEAFFSSLAKKNLDNIDPEAQTKIEFVYPNLRFNEIKNKTVFLEDDVRLLKCPLTNEFLVDPVVAPNGETYERKAIIDYFKKNKKLPSPPEIPSSVQIKFDENTNIKDFLYPHLFMKSLMDYPEIQAFKKEYLSQQAAVAIDPQQVAAIKDGAASAAAPPPAAQGHSRLVKEFVNKHEMNIFREKLSAFLQTQLKDQINEKLKNALDLVYKNYTMKLEVFDSHRLTQEEAQALRDRLINYFRTLRCYSQMPIFLIRPSESENRSEADVPLYRIFFKPMDLVDALRLHMINDVLSPDPRSDYGSLDAVPFEDMRILTDQGLDIYAIMDRLSRSPVLPQQPVRPPVAGAAAAAVAAVEMGVNANNENEEVHFEIGYLKVAIKTLFEKIEDRSRNESSESDHPHYVKLKDDFDNILKLKLDSPDATAKKMVVDVVLRLDALISLPLDYKREAVELRGALYKRYESGYSRGLLGEIANEIRRAKAEEEIHRASQPMPAANPVAAKPKSKGFLGKLFSKKDKKDKDKDEKKSESKENKKK